MDKTLVSLYFDGSLTHSVQIILLLCMCICLN